MELSKKEYPYPVLSEGRCDFSEECSFSISLVEDEINVTSENIEIPVSYHLVCKSIESGVENGLFIPIIKVKSSGVSYCRVFKFSGTDNHMVIKIGKYEVSEKIELSGMIVSTTLLKNYLCPEMNYSVFSGKPFDYEVGDPIAIDNPKIIYLDDSELEKPITSIFLINQNDQEEDIDVVFDDERIVIYLNDKLNKIYWHLKDINNGSFRRYVTAIIVTPALVEAIDQIKQYYSSAESDTDYSDKRWFRSIEIKAEQLGYKMSEFSDSSTMLADKLLGNISLDSLTSFKEIIEKEMNSGETQMIGGVD